MAAVRLLSASTARGTVKTGDDGLSDGLELGKLVLKVLGGSLLTVALHPLLLLGDSVENGLLVIRRQLATGTLRVLDGALHREDGVLKAVQGLDLLSYGSVLIGKLFSFPNHSLNVVGAQSALLAVGRERCGGGLVKTTSGEPSIMNLLGDNDGLALSGTLVDGGNGQDTVGYESQDGGSVDAVMERPRAHQGQRLTVNLERDLDLGLTTRSGRNVGQVELAEHVVVLGHRSFTLVNLDGNGRLVVDGSGEDLGLFGGHDGVPGAVV